MDLVSVYKSTDLGEIAVMKSKLEAAGLHPFVQNREHAYMAHLYILALGGVSILVPESERDVAQTVIADRTGEFPDTDIFDDYEPPQSYKHKKPYRPSVVPLFLAFLLAILLIVFTSLDFYGFLIGGLVAILFHAQRTVVGLKAKRAAHES